MARWPRTVKDFILAEVAPRSKATHPFAYVKPHLILGVPVVIVGEGDGKVSYNTPK